MVTPARRAQIRAFLVSAGWGRAAAAPLAGDASDRRYERLAQDGNTAVLMDAPPGGPETPAFLAVARLLAGQGIAVPGVMAALPADGLVLLEDFGDATYAALLDGGSAPAPLYAAATDVLIRLRQGYDPASAGVGALPHFSAALFVDQLALFCEERETPPSPAAVADFRAIWSGLLAPAEAGPQSLLLRDYHAGNLFWLPARQGVARCGVIDFQDCGRGPALYDLASLLEDARRDLPDAVVAACLARYRTAFPTGDDGFARLWHPLAALRHLRVIAVFRRLARQGRPEYLVHMPRLQRYLGVHLQAPVLAPLAGWLDRHAPETAAVD